MYCDRIIITDEKILQNANTISHTTPISEQIDNAELQEKANVNSELDNNKNDKESDLTNITKTVSPEREITTITPAEAELNNGPFTDES